MELLLVFIAVSLFPLGVLAGLLIGKKRDPIGAIRIDHSDPRDGPYLFLELSKPIDELYKSKYVTLEVQVKDYISQK